MWTGRYIATALLVVLAMVTEARAEVLFEPAGKLVLGESNSLQLRVRAPNGSSFELVTNVGSIGPASRGGDGLWTATYSAPKSRYPQVAIIAAVDSERRLLAWTPLKLYGKPELRLKSEPNARVIVRVGEEQVGPIQTDRRGRAKVKVLVAPGIRAAQMIVSDDLGNKSTEALPLKAPPFERLLAVCPQGGDELVILAVDEKGDPATQQPLEVNSTVGTMAAAEKRLTGVFVSRLSVEAATVAKSATISVVATEGQSSRAQCDAPLPLELPTALAMSFGRDSYVAGSGQPIPVRITVQFPGLREPRGVRVELTTEQGKVSRARQTSSSSFEATWTPDDELQGQGEGVLTARILGTEVRGQGKVALKAGAPSVMALSFGETTLIADGRRETSLRVRLRDAHGNPVSARGVAIEGSALGTISEFAIEKDGSASARYRAPLRYRSLADQVVVSAAQGALEARQQIRLRPALRRFSASVQGGYQSNLGQLGSPLLSVTAGARLPVLGNRLLCSLESGYYSDTYTEMDEGPNREGVRGIPLRLRLTYELPRGAFRLHGGVGAGAIFARSEIGDPERSGSVVTQSTLMSFGGLLGAGYSLGPGRALGEIAYWYARLEDAPVTGNIAGLSLSAGYGLDF